MEYYDLLLIGSFLIFFCMFCIYAISKHKKALLDADKRQIKDPFEKVFARIGIGFFAYLFCAAFSFSMDFFFNTDFFIWLFMDVPDDLLFGEVHGYL